MVLIENMKSFRKRKIPKHILKIISSYDLRWQRHEITNNGIKETLLVNPLNGSELWEKDFIRMKQQLIQEINNHYKIKEPVYINKLIAKQLDRYV